MREALEQLAAAALLGTRRNGALPTLAAPGRIAEALQSLDGREAERGLLDAAAIVAPSMRAGFVAAKFAVDPERVAAAESRPACPRGAAELLKRILGGEHAELLPEWLRLAAERGVIAPPETLPDLLAAAKGKADLREPLAAVLGERGRWLARLNPDWAFAAAGDDAGDAEERWQTGAPEERLAALRAVRHREPARALAMVQSTWGVDPPEQRVKFVATLAAKLSMADEAFLEAALDDKRKPVRAAAAELLVRLPESRLIARMVERLRPLLAWEAAGKRGQPRLKVELPDACTKAMARDGVEEKPPTNKVGQGAWWLAGMLASVPSSHWHHAWGATPDELVAAALAGEWAAALLHGWLTGAMRSVDASWAACVCSVPARVKAESVLRVLAEMRTFEPLRGYLTEVPQDAREAAVAAGVRAAVSASDTAGAIALLGLCPIPWSPALSVAAVAIEPPRGGKGRYSAESTLRSELARLLSKGVHPSLGTSAAAQITACFSGDDAPLANGPLDLLDFRLRIHQEF